jgi:hypothetical protein
MIIIPGYLKNEKNIRKLHLKNSFSPLIPKSSKQIIQQNSQNYGSRSTKKASKINQTLLAYKEPLIASSLPKFPIIKSVSSKSTKELLSIIDFSANSSNYIQSTITRLSKYEIKQPTYIKSRLSYLRKNTVKNKKSNKVLPDPIKKIKILFNTETTPTPTPFRTPEKYICITRYEKGKNTRYTKKKDFVDYEKLCDSKNSLDDIKIAYQNLKPLPKLKKKTCVLKNNKTQESSRSISAKKIDNILQLDSFEEFDIAGW